MRRATKKRAAPRAGRPAPSGLPWWIEFEEPRDRDKLQRILSDALDATSAPRDPVQLEARHVLALHALIQCDLARDRIEDRARDTLDPQGKFAAAFKRRHKKVPTKAQRAAEALRLLEVSKPFAQPIVRREAFLFAERIRAGDSVADAIDHVAEEHGLTVGSARTILQKERGKLRRRIESYGDSPLAREFFRPLAELLDILGSLPSGR